MDSSSVLASAVGITDKKQHAFSTLYVDKTYDESGEIKSMLDKAVIQWHTVTIDNPDIFGIVWSMIAAHDEPVATATWLSHFLLCEEASKKGFSSLFGGLGGDELNAGEYEYFFFYFADLKVAGLEQQLSQEIEKWTEYHNHPVFIKNRTVAEDSISRLVDLNKAGKCLPDKKRLLRYASALNPEFFNLSTYEPVMDHQFNSYLKNRTCQDIYRETVPCCLRAEDRQTMAFNLDNFLPFFDYRLVEFMFCIPGNLKISKGITKVLLREAMKDILPEETRTRIKKTGWNAPAHLWFSGNGKQRILDLIASQEFRQRGIYNVNEVERLLNEHNKIVTEGIPVENHMMFFWQLVNLELWLQSVKEI
jgi:asparagine synthase (glutamine-hydrolysing)